MLRLDPIHPARQRIMMLASEHRFGIQPRQPQLQPRLTYKVVAERRIDGGLTNDQPDGGQREHRTDRPANHSTWLHAGRPGSSPFRLGAPRRECTRGPWGRREEIFAVANPRVRHSGIS